ncbi:MULTISPECIES: cytochrome P450 [Methylobacterium]|jgi:cytochrome P450|uniref:Cytochrome P450 n=1 Tax=Methylobacterium oryzae CBMB20 TaxID=693986 RepID=A0A089NPY7_9HYPH|nr:MULTISPECIES: cytochrome P450 [Methylobacterium]AIQ89986.1 Cytochrome P450 [Methylobacterium oryzae CBMB20]MDE4913419.1 cytochrome P450 [Methylobacterium sp. 092160098-2]SFU32635.1 Cytochrome P450 [Methylobacterium sp. UNCCL125]
MPDATLLNQVKDFANRPNPYPIYARLRENPVSRQDDGTEEGTWVAATHGTIASLLQDPRVSSETLPPADRPRTGNPLTDLIVKPLKDWMMDRHRVFIFRDPPDHDALRSAVMHQFSRERVQAMRARSDQLVADLLDEKCGAREIDAVDDLAYPLPVTVICELFGVPREDEPKFHGWATQLATALEPDSLSDPEIRAENSRTFDAIGGYMADLIKDKRKHPGDDMLSGLANHATPAGVKMGDYDLIATSILMLVAGHETTVNLITNGLLTLLRHPDELERLRQDPLRAPRLIEELLRYEPPVQFRTRRTLSAIDIAGVTIPEGADLVLLLASGNRDGAVFPDPDRFDPDRAGLRHLGFGGSLHYCVGAPLARFEAEAALTALARRLKAPRLIEDPPPYRSGAALRGPEHLRVAIDGIA